MRLEGEHLFATSRERLWAALLDPTLLSNVLPGCEPLESTGENSWKAAMTVAIGPVKGRFSGSLALSDLVPLEGYAMKIDGSGPSGFLRGSGAVKLEAAEGGTKLRYEVDAQVGGRIASVGQRLVESSARAIAKQGLEGLERELAARAPVEEPAPSTALGSTSTEAGSAAVPAAAPAHAAVVSKPPSQAAFAGRFAVGLWRELPASWRAAGVVVAIGALAGIVLLLRGC